MNKNSFTIAIFRIQRASKELPTTLPQNIGQLFTLTLRESMFLKTNHISACGLGQLQHSFTMSSPTSNVP